MRKYFEWEKKIKNVSFLTTCCPCLPTTIFPQLQNYCAVLSGHLSPSCEDKFTLSVWVRLRVYKEVRLKTEFQRSISVFPRKALIWFRLRWGNSLWFLVNIHHMNHRMKQAFLTWCILYLECQKTAWKISCRQKSPWTVSLANLKFKTFDFDVFCSFH